MKMKFMSATLAVLLLASGCATAKQQDTKNITKQVGITSVTISKKTVAVEVMDNDEKRERGLSGRAHLSPDSGMLFDFTSSSDRLPAFWMKDMLFDIDILWIKNGKVIAINRSVPKPAPNTPLNQLRSYLPPSEIDYVLEVNSGWSVKNKIEIGELVTFK